MDIYKKLDQFVKSARYLLSQRELLKQAGYPLYDWDMGQRNAANFQRNVNLNPRPRYPSYSKPRSYSAPRPQQPQNRAPAQSDGRKLWSQLANAAKTPEHLQQMVNIAPRLIGNRDDYQELLDRGMRYAIGNINRATGSNYSWFGGKLDLTGGASAATPTTPRPTAPRTPGYTPRSTATPTTRTTTPAATPAVGTSVPGGTPTEYGFSADKSSLDGIPLTAREKSYLTLGDARAKDLIRRNRKMSAAGGMAKTHGVKGPDGTYSLTLKGGKPVTPTATPTPAAPTRPTTPRPTAAPSPGSSFLSPASLTRSIDRVGAGAGVSADSLVDYSRPKTLPGMPPATPMKPTRSMPTMGPSYGYGAPPSSSGAGASFMPRPTRTGSF